MRTISATMLTTLVLVLVGPPASGSAAPLLWVVADGRLSRVEPDRLSIEPVGKTRIGHVSSLAAVGSRLYALMQDGGNNCLYAVDPETGVIRLLWTFDAAGNASDRTLMVADGENLFVLQQNALYRLTREDLDTLELSAQERTGVVPAEDGGPEIQPLSEPWFNDVTAMAWLERSLYIIQADSLFRVNPANGKRRRLLAYTLGGSGALCAAGENLLILVKDQLFEVSRRDGAERMVRQDERWRGAAHLASGSNRVFLCAGGNLYRLDPTTGATLVVKTGPWKNTDALTVSG